MTLIIHSGKPKKDIFGRYHNLLIIGGGVLQHQTLIECDRLGLGKILVDRDPKCYCGTSPFFNRDFFVQADIKEPEEVLSQVRKWLRKHPKVKIVGVYTQGCDCAYTVAYMANKLGLPNIGLDTAYKSHDKVAMRLVFSKYNIPQPKLYTTEEDIKYPFIVKPVDNCASRGITIVRKPEEFEHAKNKAKSYSSDGSLIIEEFIDGKEYSVDTIVYKGKVYPAGISDRVFLDKDRYAVQDGSLTPSLLPEETQRRMYQIMQQCATALNLKWGALKGDLIVDTEGRIYVLEVTTRLSGGFDSQFRKPYSFGVNLIKATIDLACGKPLDFNDIIPKWFKYSQTFSIFPKPGIIKEVRGEKELRKIPGIRNIFITKHVGSVVEYKSCADRIVHIIACADTYEELQKIIAEARQTLQIITE